MRILIWHVHGGWMDAFVQGGHTYLLPTDPRRGPWGLGRGGRPWPPGAVEVDLGELHDEQIDVVVLQRSDELARVEQLTGRRPGRDVPAVFLEHNTPKREPVTERHPLADRDDVPIVHVTHFNDVVWDSGRAPTIVIEHGVPDPGRRYTGRIDRLAFVSNEPVRRRRIVGADLLPRFAAGSGIDVFGMGVGELPAALGIDPVRVRPMGDLPPAELHASMADRRAYLHLSRWTSLGLALIEAMMLGMPVVVLDATEAARAVPPGAGFVSTSVDSLVAAARMLVDDPVEATRLGAAAREAALDRYDLGRFLRDWDVLLAEVVEHAARRARTRRPDGSAGPG
ncbi:glycosyltransferase [Agromyces aerolatus]|uniref:glycosyltransferase n=1 Tax=Agromyces sp. LY-1074 TaxID=3074080 RepID=UPI002858750D|nr:MULTISPECIES: glycosyltransferase [unclassified Agromyces]MDR5700588.1 glycosyltransferase [Agromyces sp. LY-1074]MDR5707109.1 glycosyltransferase [Agromyces sp. LY-1358]